MAEKGAAAVVDDKGTAAGTAGADDAGKKTDDAAAGKTGDAAAAGDGKKTDGTTATETGSKAAETKVEAKAPEKYDLKLPDGGRIDAEELKHFEAVARSQNWTNDQAQQAVKDHAAALEAQSTRFLETTKADAEYGGEKLAETQKFAKSVLDRVRPAGTPRGDALRQLLDKSGYGNNLEVISFLADLGRMTAEDSTTGGTGGGKGESRDAAAVLYGGAKT